MYFGSLLAHFFATKNKKASCDFGHNRLILLMVGDTGFEPVTSTV